MIVSNLPFCLCRIDYRFVTPYSAVVHYAPRWHSVRPKLKIMCTRSPTDSKSQRYFIVVVRSQNETSSILYLRGGAIGYCPDLEYCCFGCPSPLLDLPWGLRLLVCALNVISAF